MSLPFQMPMIIRYTMIVFVCSKWNVPSAKIKSFLAANGISQLASSLLPRPACLPLFCQTMQQFTLLAQQFVVQKSHAKSPSLSLTAKPLSASNRPSRVTGGQSSSICPTKTSRLLGTYLAARGKRARDRMLFPGWESGAFKMFQSCFKQKVVNKLGFV